MYVYHGWFYLCDTLEDTFDGTPLYEGLEDLQEVLAGFGDHVNTVAEVKGLNGEYYLWIHGCTNRRLVPGQASAIDAVLDFLAKRLPGSHGLMYERDTEMVEPPGGNAYRVRVLARGTVVERPDPFLSPCDPTIEGIAGPS